jgi:MoaA/NifB/PqqE/SkfB family radical SAM enzyme
VLRGDGAAVHRGDRRRSTGSGFVNRIDTLSGPLLVSWQMTRDCNLACLHCCTSSAPGHPWPNELNAAEALRFAADLVAAEIPYVMLCGGEPTLLPHFMEVAETLGRGGVRLKIETNGQTLDDVMAERLAALPIRSIQISLDGDTEASYRKQRPGASLARVHAACRAVRQAGMKLEVTFAPTKFNIEEAAAVIARAQSLGAFRFNTGALMPIGRAALLWEKIAPSGEQLASFRALLSQVQDNIDSSMQLCYEPFSVEAGLRQSIDTPPATLLVLPNGDVGLSGLADIRCGNIRRTGLTEIWKSYCSAWADSAVLAGMRRQAEAFASAAAGTGVYSRERGVVEHA